MQQDQPLHPRPQLTRPRWTDLCGPWGFAYDDEDVGLRERWQERAEVFTRQIQVPFPPESPASGIGDTGFHPVVWYRRTFRRDVARHGERLLLHCGAVDYRAAVWVNGHLVATHEGGATPFSADVTAVLSADDEQVIVVRAEDRPGDLSQPRGKQDWQERPHRVWYERTTGIWQPVWLEPVPLTYVERVRWTPDLDRSVLGLEVRLARHDQRPLRVRVRLSQHGTALADDVYAVRGDTVTREIGLDRADFTLHRRRTLWAPDHPNLVEAVITVLDGDRQVDEVASYTGLRSVSASGGRFLLNGRSYYLRMALEQGYWPQSHLAAPDPDALRREVELAKELGFNGVRIHQKVEDPRFLYWCDRLGLLVWGEMPSAFEFTHLTQQRLTREWLEVLDRDHSHPSIVAWVPLNESWGVPHLRRDPAQRDFVRALYHLTKSLDPTRLAIGNDGWEHIVSDVFTVHDYSSEGTTLRERYGDHEAVERTLERVQPYYRSVVLPGLQRSDEPLMVTEFGGLTLRSDAGFWNAYGTVASAEEFLAKYTELVDALLDSPVVAGFCYTQLTDTVQEQNGLLTAERRPKLDPAEVCRVNQRTAAAVPGDAIAVLQLGGGVPAAGQTGSGSDPAAG
ncbi:MAG TPA: glycoside hydrolase family 2 TIM barrel-domain containing protein [Actinomycetes bacterium]|nr:glycoside hydrolase family 2 TIM barrel-domain containing protein [Actinomycetes bacterium]